LEENPFLENENLKHKNQENLNEEKTEDLDESFDSGESLSDEPHNDDYDNRWDTEIEKSYEFKNSNNSIESSDAGSVIEQTLSNTISLKSILHNQAVLEFKTEKEKKISDILIDYIDDNGWLLEELESICDFSGYKKEEIEEILIRMQTFEPNGVFARNIKECLKIQLKNNNLLDDNKEIIIDNLDLLGNGNIRALQKLTNLDDMKLKEQIRIIRSLNPKPGQKYNGDPDNIFQPAVIVSKNNSDLLFKFHIIKIG
jgi:RNA polymerase sigma-54 factor